MMSIVISVLIQESRIQVPVTRNREFTAWNHNPRLSIYWLWIPKMGRKIPYRPYMGRNSYIASEQAWWNVITYMWYVDISTYTNKDILNIDSNIHSFFSNFNRSSRNQSVCILYFEENVYPSFVFHRGVVDSIHLKNRFYLNRNRNLIFA